MTTRERLAVNWTTCVGHGLCAELLPELVHLDDWGYPVVETAGIPPYLEEHVRHAIDACPTLALFRQKTEAKR
jgi:ferredoxin